MSQELVETYTTDAQGAATLVSSKMVDKPVLETVEDKVARLLELYDEIQAMKAVN